MLGRQRLLTFSITLLVPALAVVMAVCFPSVVPSSLRVDGRADLPRLLLCAGLGAIFLSLMNSWRSARRTAMAAAEDAHVQREQLRTTLASVGDAILGADGMGCVTFLNPNAEKLTGWPQAEAIGRPMADVFRISSETTRRPVKDAAAKTAVHLGLGHLASQALLHSREDTHLPIDFNAVPIRTTQGRLAGTLVVFRDAAESRRAREAVRFLTEEGEALASSLDVEATLTGAARLAVPRLADWCCVYLAVEGGPLRLMAARHADPAKLEILRELDRRYPLDPAVLDGLPRVLRTGRPELVPEVTEERIVASAHDAEHLRILRALAPRSFMLVPLNARGRTLGAIAFVTAESGRHYGEADVILAEDLARRAALAVDNARLYREAQGAIRLGEEAANRLSLLAEASGRLTSSLELTAVQSAILDLSNRLIAADAYAVWRRKEESGHWEIAESAGLSEAYLRSAGHIPLPGSDWPTEPLIAEDAQRSALMAEREESYRVEGVASLLAVPLRVHGVSSGTLVFHYRSRRTFDDADVRVATALANLAGAAIGTAELYQRESELRHQAQEEARRKDTFLAMLAHELRNPLAPVRNALHVLALADGNGAVARESRAMIERQVRHLARLIDDLLDVSRVGQGKVRLRPERLNLVEQVRAGAADRRSHLEEGGLTLDLELSAAPLWVNADPTRLAQILDNLLGNAAKFTDPGGHVIVRVRADGGRAVVEVQDSGVGIAPELLPQVWEAFMQADDSLDRSRGGLGLGLSLVRGLALLHAGGVNAQSLGPGLGSTFSFWLPLSTDTAVPIKSSPESATEPARLAILIVEDNRDAAESLRQLLELSGGHNVSVAYTGSEGLEVRRTPPDVVLCDLGLPGLSGFDVARDLRHDPATASAFLVAVSGYGQIEDRERSSRAGFDAHLLKPVEVEELRRLLATRKSGRVI